MQWSKFNQRTGGKRAVIGGCLHRWRAATQVWVVAATVATVSLVGTSLGPRARAASATAADQRQPVTLTWWVVAGDTEDLYQELATTYHKLHPEVSFKIEPQTSWDSLVQKLLLAAAAGKPPALTQFHNAFTSRLFPVFEPIPESIWPRQAMQELFWSLEAGSEVNGSIRFTLGGLMTPLLWLNLDRFDEAGLQPNLSTWDELRVDARKLTRYAPDGRVQVTGFDGNGPALWDDLVYQQGQFMWDEKGTRLQLNTLAGQRALTLVYQLQVQDKSWHPEMEYWNGTFLRNQVGILYEWGFYRHVVQAQAKFRWTAVRIPTWTGQPKPAVARNNYETDFAVLAAAPTAEKAAAFRFLRWVYEESSFPVKRNLALTRIPSVKRLWTNPAFTEDAVFRATLQTIPYSIFPGERPAWISEIISEAYQKMRTGTALENALATAQEKADARLRREPVFWIAERRSPAES
ncbi:MAG: extracellular solute-binding protein [Limnochordaceae bacterium]|nr:extracellular solute-binding protein [Limnochordaceae bacterium]